MAAQAATGFTIEGRRLSEVEAAVDSGDPDALVFETGDVVERVADRGDLFAPVLRLRQSVSGLS